MNAFKQLSIKTQIATPILLLTLVILVLTAAGWYIGKLIERNVAGLTEHLAPASELVLNGDRDLYQSAVALRDYRELKQHQAKEDSIAKARNNILENRQQAYDRMHKARSTASTEGVKLYPEKDAEYEQVFGNWSQLVDQVMALIDQQHYDEAYQLQSGNYEKTFATLRKFYDAFEDELVDQRQQLSEKTVTLEHQQMQLTTGLALLALLLGLVFTLLLPRFISATIDDITEKMRRLSQSGGDLTQRLPSLGNNELGRLISAINGFIGYLQQLIHQVNNESHTLQQDSRELVDAASATGQRANQQFRDIEDAVSAVSQMNSAVKEISHQTQLSSDKANHAQQEMNQSHRQINAAIEQIRSLVDNMDSAIGTIGKLEAESRNIVSVLDVIGGIADQTNLLALNAAIEAARAGDSGRGFAVVADEVRNLAMKTQESTRNIQAMIERLNQGVNHAVTVIHQSSELVNSTASQASAAGGTLNQVVTLVDEMMAISLQIAAATEQQSTVISHINHNMENVSGHSHALLDHASSASELSQRLQQSSQRLAGQMTHFQV